MFYLKKKENTPHINQGLDCCYYLKLAPSKPGGIRYYFMIIINNIFTKKNTQIEREWKGKLSRKLSMCTMTYSKTKMNWVWNLKRPWMSIGCKANWLSFYTEYLVGSIYYYKTLPNFECDLQIYRSQIGPSLFAWKDERVWLNKYTNRNTELHN